MSRTASSSGSAFVSRFDVGQTSSAICALAQVGHQRLVLSGEDPVPDPLRAQRVDDVADLGDAVIAALLADVDRHPETG